MGGPQRCQAVRVTLAVFSALFAGTLSVDTSDDVSLVHSGRAFWLCMMGIEGVACGPRREPSLNSCETFKGACPTSDGASHCVELRLSGRLSGAACVCQSSFVADQQRQKCVPDVCADNACGPADAVKFCYPSKVVTTPLGQTKEHPITGKFICTCRTGYVLNTRDNTCQEKCSDEEAAHCGPAEAHDAEHCSMGLAGRICACKDGFKWNLESQTCVKDDCYSPAWGWQEGVKACVKQDDQRLYSCAEGFQKNASKECLPECLPGWRYNRNRELCELSTSSCSLSDCGATEAVEACLVDKDSGKQICKCKAGYALHTETGMCTSLPACQVDTCKIFGPDAVCVSDGSAAYSCQCISEMKTVGDETTPVVKDCDPVECPDPSICGKGEAVMECIQGPSAHRCLCSPGYTLDENTGICIPIEGALVFPSSVPAGAARVSATRAPMHFSIKARPCVSAVFNASSRTFDVTTHYKDGETNTTSVTLPYHSGLHTGTSFTFRLSPAPGGFDVTIAYELRPTRSKQVMEQTSFRVYMNPVSVGASEDLGGGVNGAIAAVMVSAGDSPCEVAAVEVAAMAEDRRFENLTVLFEKLPTADENAPLTDTGFPTVGGSDTVTMEFPSPSGDSEEPPEPEADTPLPFPKPTDPLKPEGPAPDRDSVDCE
ncbi:hypothetical protein, conserved [Eimeria brunetti]|uniref:EGF-like domain-containing protein n=1 Tax=Eimeria brunetti TaxID=51314 RepID=U6LV19_9EIME|nr:hypothetical protein, conserved [Eimeria brunetti]